MTTAILERPVAQQTERVDEFSAALDQVLVGFGEKLGLYNALAELGPANAGEFSRHIGVWEALIGGWLEQQAANDYLYVDSAGRYSVYCPLPEYRN